MTLLARIAWLRTSILPDQTPPDDPYRLFTITGAIAVREGRPQVCVGVSGAMNFTSAGSGFRGDLPSIALRQAMEDVMKKVWEWEQSPAAQELLDSLESFQ